MAVLQWSSQGFMDRLHSCNSNSSSNMRVHHQLLDWQRQQCRRWCLQARALLAVGWQLSRRCSSRAALAPGVLGSSSRCCHAHSHRLVATSRRWAVVEQLMACQVARPLHRLSM